LLLVVLAAAGTAAASTLNVSPVRIELSPTVSTAVLTLRNPEDAPVTVQATPAAWSQADQQDQLTDTHDVLVTPPLFTIPPKGHQIVRVALLRKPDASRELDYRLVLAEIPPPGTPESTGLRFALRITMPITTVPPTSRSLISTYRPRIRPPASCIRTQRAICCRVARPTGRYIPTATSRAPAAS